MFLSNFLKFLPPPPFQNPAYATDNMPIYIFIYEYTRCIFSIAVRSAVSGFILLLPSNRQYTGWVKDRVLKPAQKLSLVITFVPSESARPDQIDTKAEGKNSKDSKR